MAILSSRAVPEDPGVRPSETAGRRARMTLAHDRQKTLPRAAARTGAGGTFLAQPSEIFSQVSYEVHTDWHTLGRMAAG